MIFNDVLSHSISILLASSLQGELQSFCGAWLRCNSLEWNNHSASFRLALHSKNRALHPVQLPDLG
jgi:hypothetical protein